MQPTFLHLARAVLSAGNTLYSAGKEYDIASSPHARKSVKARFAKASAEYRSATAERDMAVERYRLALMRAGQRPVCSDRLDPYFIINHAGLYYSRHR